MLPVIKQLGIPGIIDVHAHFMPDSVLRKVWRVFDEAPQVYGVDWPIEYRHDELQRVAILRDLGVVRYTSLVYAHKPGMAAWLNEWSAAFAAEHSGCVQTGTFFPEPGVLDYVSGAIAAGARIFKIHLQVGDFDPRDELLAPVWEVLAGHHIPTVVHCGSGPIPGRFTGVGPMRDLIRTHPDVPIIVAHLGAPEYRDFFELSGTHEHVYLDTTMALTPFMEALAPFPSDLVDQLRELGLAGKVLFGSDFPNIPYSYESAVDSLAALDLGTDWLSAVLFGAGAELLELAT